MFWLQATESDLTSSLFHGASRSQERWQRPAEATLRCWKRGSFGDAAAQILLTRSLNDDSPSSWDNL